MLITLQETRNDLHTAHDAIRSASARILADSGNEILRATISGLLLGLDSQIAAVTAAVTTIAKNGQLIPASPAHIKETNA